MNFPWAICLALKDAASLGRLRLVAGIEVGGAGDWLKRPGDGGQGTTPLPSPLPTPSSWREGEDGADAAAQAGDVVWLRGRPVDENIGRILQALPAIAHYELFTDGRLRNIDARIPAERLPELSWQPLAAWLRVELPAAAMAATTPASVPLRLVRSSAEREPDLLLAELGDWEEFARSAAQVRLERLQFAADADGKILVRGRPLPALPGRRFVLNGGIAVPAGFGWLPAVSTEVLVRRFGAVDGALILWHENGGITRLLAEQFIPATRSAVRATAAALEFSS